LTTIDFTKIISTNLSGDTREDCACSCISIHAMKEADHNKHNKHSANEIVRITVTVTVTEALVLRPLY